MMNMEYSDDQLMMQETSRKFFEREVSPQLVKELQEPEHSGHSSSLWEKMANIGWLGVHIPEKYNGAGGTLVDLGILFEEAGRVLVPTTLYSTIYASLLIDALGTHEQKKTYLSRIAAGKMISGVAYAEKEALHNPDCFKTVARKVKDKWILTGEKMFVQNAHLADELIVIARSENDDGKEGLTAFLVPNQAEGVSMKEQKTFGKDRQSVVKFTDVELDITHVLGNRTEEAEEGLAVAMNQATALQCLEMVGGARKVIDMTVKYVSERHQFGVPIGSFQAVQHHLANMATAVDGSRLLAYQAVSLLSEGLAAEDEVAMAKAYAGEAYKSVTVMAHQLWGGMGYVTESDLYLWSNRAKATELSFGTRDLHLKKLANNL
ncbi:acyl-CoA dehydrogenase family protein [Bacillus dakarensis]|uniref:acyl-CoA dehydrogenase family protein n=1 Tax=Robertmurraya dakarensis TaxID=1926278 RepID=UPI000A042CAB|nr:acyl-CoA dehydrogenase family protein [Bacillus dakarensis]